MSVVDGTVTSGAVTGGSGVTLASVVVDAGHSAMLVAVNVPSGGFPTDITAMSWGGVNFARVADQTTGNSQSVDTWIGVGLTPGTASLTFSAAHGFSFKLACISLGGVDTGTPTGAASTVQSSTNLNNAAVATTAGGHVVGCGVAETSSTFTAQNSQTQLFDSLFAGTVTLHVGKQTAVGTSTQDRYTVTAFGALVSFQINASSPNATVTPSGFALTASLGSAVPAISMLPGGQVITSSLGTATAGSQSSVTLTPSGFAVSFSQGTFTTQNDITMTPAGGSLALSLGTATTTGAGGNVNFVPTGFALSGGFGTPTVVGDVVVPISGLSFASSLGSPSVVFPALTALPVGFAMSALLNGPRVLGPVSGVVHDIHDRSRRSGVSSPANVDISS